MSAASTWWPRRRAEPSASDEAMGDEAGCLPFCLEPEETLGDTGPAPMYDTPSQHLAREARVNVRIYALVCAFALACYFGWIA